MKIVETRSSGAAQRSARPRRSAAGDFAGALGADSEVPAGAPTRPTPAAGSVLLAQEIGDAAEERRRARARGEDLLDRLDAIRICLLEGSIPEHRLAGLLAAVRARRTGFVDPRLGEVLDEIELRASVELAKLGRCP